MFHDGSGQRLSLQCNTMHQKTVSGILLLHSWLVTKTSTVYHLFLSKSVWLHSQHLSQILYSQRLPTGMCSHCMGSVSAEWSLEVSIYHGSTLGTKFLSQVFPSYLQGEAQALGPQD